MHRRMSRYRWSLLLTAAAFALAWLAVATAGGASCGNEDTVECSPLGWALLIGWVVLAVALFGLIALGVFRLLRESGGGG